MLFWRWRDLRLYSHVAIGIAALALLVVDSTVAGVRSGDAASAMSIGGHQPSARLIGGGAVADAVTSGHGEIWTLGCYGAGAGRRCTVSEVNPHSGVEVTSVRVPRPASYLFYGAGRVWATGGRRISAVDPATGRLAGELLDGGTVRSMAFHGSTAYAAVVGRDEVLAIRPGSRLRTKVIDERGGPLAVIALPDAIEVTNDTMNLVPIIFGGANTSFLAALQLGRPIIATAGRQAAWVRRGHELVRETLGADGRPARKYVEVRERPLDVVTTADRGCYVAVASHTSRSASLLYFSAAELAAHHPRPTAMHRGRLVTGLALDPAGGVVYIDRSGALRSWDPAA